MSAKVYRKHNTLNSSAYKGLSSRRVAKCRREAKRFAAGLARRAAKVLSY